MLIFIMVIVSDCEKKGRRKAIVHAGYYADVEGVSGVVVFQIYRQSSMRVLHGRLGGVRRAIFAADLYAVVNAGFYADVEGGFWHRPQCWFLRGCQCGFLRGRRGGCGTGFKDYLHGCRGGLWLVQGVCGAVVEEGFGDAVRRVSALRSGSKKTSQFGIQLRL